MEDVFVTALVFRQHLKGELTELSGAEDDPNKTFDACAFSRDLIYKMLPIPLTEAWNQFLDAKQRKECVR